MLRHRIQPDRVYRRAAGLPVRRGSDPKSIAEMRTFSGRTIDVPSVFIAGKSDWGVYQTPGAAETMQTTACTRMVGFHLVDGAGKVAGFSGSCSGRASAGVTPSSSRRAIRPWAGSRAPTAGAAAHRSDRRR